MPRDLEQIINLLPAIKKGPEYQGQITHIRPNFNSYMVGYDSCMHTPHWMRKVDEKGNPNESYDAERTRLFEEKYKDECSNILYVFCNGSPTRAAKTLFNKMVDLDIISPSGELLVEPFNKK